MTFIGRLKQHTEIWRRWHGEARVSGALQGVIFTKEPGNIYRTEPLDKEQIELLKGHESVILESYGRELPPVVDVVAEVERPVAGPVIILGNKPPWQQNKRRA